MGEGIRPILSPKDYRINRVEPVSPADKARWPIRRKPETPEEQNPPKDEDKENPPKKNAEEGSDQPKPGLDVYVR